MKIEMGESLFYSWLRHVKECQIVQTNWKSSPQWELFHEEKLAAFMKSADMRFYEKYKYSIFKKNASLSQIIRQGECDALGISVQDDGNHYYAIDVAFHTGGLNYSTKQETVMKVIEKAIRTAMCLYGLIKSDNAEIIFASPKINNATFNDLLPCVDDINSLFQAYELNYSFRLIANEDFNKTVLQPILVMSDGIADTSELFVRSYQMYTMFSNAASTPKESNCNKSSDKPREFDYQDTSIYKELKVGQIAQSVLRKLLENGAADEEEILHLQEKEYSKKVLHLNFPLLVQSGKPYDRVRYYATPLMIRGTKYMLCSQWAESPANNDRPHLLKWIEEHTK